VAGRLAGTLQGLESIKAGHRSHSAAVAAAKLKAATDYTDFNRSGRGCSDHSIYSDGIQHAEERR